MKSVLVRISYVAGLGAVFLIALFLLLTSGAFSPARGADEVVHKYVGAESCAKVCHKTAKQGGQLTIWQGTRHAQAFATLATEKAKEIAKAKGIADPQKAPECLACHTTAPKATDAQKDAKFTNDEGVGCERCHGPGSDYKTLTIMKDRAKSVAAGLLIPDEKTCIQCHNEKSPTFKGFKFEEMVAKIAHPKPASE